MSGFAAKAFLLSSNSRGTTLPVVGHLITTVAISAPKGGRLFADRNPTNFLISGGLGNPLRGWEYVHFRYAFSLTTVPHSLYVDHSARLFMWFDETQAVTPFKTEELEGLPDTYPFGG
jgi:hypothetical protein